MRLAASLPSLRHLVHRNWPVLQQPHLEHLLQNCSRLQLLETTWRPSPAPHITSSAAGASSIAAAWWNFQQERQRFEAEQAFCQAWRLRLQHRCGCAAACAWLSGWAGCLALANLLAFWRFGLPLLLQHS